MDPIIGGALISAGSSVLGGVMGDNSNDQLQARSDHQAQLDRDLQREFAHNSLSWRVADGRRAGLHPLAAIGAHFASGTPVGGGNYSSGSSTGDGIRAAGAAIAESLARRDKEKAETRLLTSQANLVDEQALASQEARINQGKQNDVLTPGFTKAPPGHEPVKPKFTGGYKFLGMNILSNPWNADAETYEGRSGEVAGAIQGAPNVPLDLLYTLGVNTKEKLLKMYEDLDPVYQAYAP